MKNLLKSLLLAASAFVLLAGCNQIGVSDATVDGAAYSEGVCYLTIGLEDFADLNVADRSVSRTINPVSFEDDASERAKLTIFVLEGTSEATGAVFEKTLTAADFTEVNVDNTDPTKGKKKQTKVEIPYGAWELTLTAKDSDGNALLQGKTFANVKTANSEAKFTLKTDGLDTPGSASIKGFFEDEGSVAKFYKVALYDLVTAERKYPSDEPTYIAVTAGTPADPSDSNSVAVLPSFEYKPTNVAPGRYSLQVSFYTSNDNNTAKKIGYWEDILEIAPGRETKNENIACGKIINQKPKSPENLRAYLKADSDSLDGYTVILTWDDESNNEENFVITVDEYGPKLDADGNEVIEAGKVVMEKKSTYRKLGAEGVGIENFFASDMYASGSVHASSKSASIKLPHGKLFEISIQAENFVGLSDADANTDGVQASVRITDALAANADLPDGVTAADTLFNAENGKINRYAINYDLDGGSLKLHSGETKNGVYSVYGSIYDFEEDDDKKLSTLLLNTTKEYTESDNTKKKNVITSLDGYAFANWVTAAGTAITATSTEELTFAGVNVKAAWDNKTLISYTIDNKYFTITTIVEYDGTEITDAVNTTATGVEKNKDLTFKVTAVNDDAAKTENTTLKIEKLSVKINNANTFLKAETIAAAPLSNSCTCTLSTKQLEGGYHTVIVTAVIDGKTYQNAFPLLYIR